MQKTIRSLSPARNPDAFISALAGFVIILALTRHGGIGVSPDSVTYISVADHIYAHGRWIDFHGDPIIDFPILYPMFLSIVQWLTGLNTLGFGPVLNALLFAALIYLSGWVMHGFSFRSKAYGWILLLCIVFSPCLVEVYSMVWSETLFLPLLLLFFFFARRYFAFHAPRALISLGIVTGLACITRYAGISLIATAGLLLICDSRLRPGTKIRHLLLFGVSAFFFPVINLVHNEHAGGTLIGIREKGLVSFGRNLHDFGMVFCNWLHIPDNYDTLASAIGLCWILFFIAVFVRRLIRKSHFFSYENIAIAFFIVYSLFILASATLSRFQQLDSRLLSPLFIPWLWGSTSVLVSRADSFTSRVRTAIWLGFGIAAACFLLGQGIADRDTWEGVKDAGIPGYTEDDWRMSETMEFVRKNKQILESSSGLYSNAYDALWFLGDVHADLLPHNDLPREIRAFLAKDRLYVVWFNDGINPDLVGTGFIKRYKRLAGVYPFSDGTVYYFTTDTLSGKPK